MITKILLIIVLVTIFFLSLYYGIHTTITTYSNLIQNYPILDNEKPLYIFYHICPSGPKWEVIVDEQINDIIKSGLYDKVTQIFYGCNCAKCDVILKEKFKSFSKITPLVEEDGINPDFPTHENKTINAMITRARSGTTDGYYLYIHSKGITDTFTGQQDWRKFMMHWNVYNHDACINILKRGFYTTGVFFRYDLPGGYEAPLISRIYIYPHYSGNFFWANSEFIKKNPYIKKLTNRYNAEIFILKYREKNKHVSFTRENINLSDDANQVINNFDKYINNQYNLGDIQITIL